MITFKRILCPTDLTSEADEALRYGVALTTAYRAKLFLLYCTERHSTQNRDSQSPHTSMFTASLAPHLGLTNFSELDWEGLVVEESCGTAETIVREALNHNVDLVVIRSRRRPRAAALLGSTAEAIASSAPCPVLVIHPFEREWVGMSSGEIDLHRILVAHDFSSDSSLALTYALSLAQEYQTELHLLHVLGSEKPREPEAVGIELGRQGEYRGADEGLRAAVPVDASLWCSRVVTEVSRGKPYEAILSYAMDHEIDLICMGSSGATSSFRDLIGSNVERVLRNAPCPVFIARPFNATIERDSIPSHHVGNRKNDCDQRSYPQ